MPVNVVTPVYLIDPAQPSGGSLKIAANQLQQDTVGSDDAKYWAVCAQALALAQSQIDAITATMRKPLPFPQVIQQTGPSGALIVEVNVKYPPYNAIGDGVHDDTVAIQTAIDFVVTAGGGTVVIPFGAYLITSDIYVTGDYVRLRGDGSATIILAGAANLRMIHWCASRGGIDQGMLFDANGYSGCTGLSVTPYDETQTTTVVQQNFNRFYGLQMRSCDEALVMSCGPSVAGHDSGCYYNWFFGTEALFCLRGIWLKNGNGGAASHSGSNRNAWFGLRVGQTGTNTGLQIDSAGTCDFFGASFEGIQSGVAPNAVPTAIIIAQANAFGSNNDSNKFFGLTMEACTRSAVIYDNFTEFHGGSPFPGGFYSALATGQPAATILFGGGGYTSVPTVTFTGGGAGCTLPTAHAVVTSNVVTSVIVDTPGALMSEVPTITFSGGGGTGASAIAILTLPKFAWGDDPSGYPMICPGMQNSEGSLPGAAGQGAWLMTKPLDFPISVGNQMVFGQAFPAANLGVAALTQFCAPNGNWGYPIVMRADSAGRGWLLGSQDFNDSTNTGAAAILSLAGLTATRLGTSFAGPYRINSSELKVDCLSASLPVVTDAAQKLVSALITTAQGGTGVPYANLAALMAGLLAAAVNVAVPGAFGANGATAQTPFASGGASGGTLAQTTTLANNIRAALIANGIMS